jgi:hypothetical protein
MKRILISISLSFCLVGASANFAGFAVSFPTITGKLTDVDGKPLSNVAVYANSPGLETTTCTKSDGSYKLQAKANQKVWLTFKGETFSIPKNGVSLRQGCNEGSDQSWYLEGRTMISTTNQNMTLNIKTPKARMLKVRVVDDESNPVFGATVQPNFGLGYGGSVGETVIPKSFNGWFGGEGGQSKITDVNGIATFGVFEVASQKEDIDAYCKFTSYCIGGEGNSEVSGMGLGERFIVRYNPRPGVQQTDYPSFDWDKYLGDVVVPIIPDLATVAPTSAKYLSTVNVSSSATISSALDPASKSFIGARASIGYTSAVKSPFSGKKASLYSRTYSNPSKPGVWKKISTCTYDKYGKCSVKLKFYATAQIQFRPEGFSSVLSTKKITKK